MNEYILCGVNEICTFSGCEIRVRIVKWNFQNIGQMQVIC